MKKIIPVHILDINNLNDYNFINSTIIDCIINNEKVLKLKYKYILNYIYNLIDDGYLIIKNTSINIKTLCKKDNRFYYLENLGISIQNNNSNKNIYEIVNQCLYYKINLDLKIKLTNNLQININLPFIQYGVPVKS